MSKLLEHLEIAEGTSVHRLSNEKDITSPYGIYKADHPTASIFKYIDEVGISLGLHEDTKQWSKDDLKLINKNINKDEIYDLADEFYKEYFKDINVEDIHPLAQLTFMSMYTNGQYYAVKSMQEALIAIKSTGLIEFSGPLSIADGYTGSKTNNAIYDTAGENDEWFGYYFEALLISRMRVHYAELAKRDPEKYLRYLNGWNKRLSLLETTK